MAASQSDRKAKHGAADAVETTFGDIGDVINAAIAVYYSGNVDLHILGTREEARFRDLFRQDFRIDPHARFEGDFQVDRPQRVQVRLINAYQALQPQVQMQGAGRSVDVINADGDLGLRRNG